MKRDKSAETYEDLAEKLKSNLDDDRTRLSDYLTRLISAISQDEERIIIAADAVAKISDSLTKQTHLSIDVMKIVAKARTQGGDDGIDPIDEEIGRPFEKRKGPN